MIKSWSYSKLEHYLECPRKFLLQDVQRTCGSCFKGTVPWGDGEKCDACGQAFEMPDPIVRGNRLHAEVEAAVLGRGPITKDLKGVTKEIKRLQKLVALGQVRVEIPFYFTKDWIPMKQFDKGRWFTGKGDIVVVPGPQIEVIDWKSGGVKDGKIRVGPKYDEQCELYSISALIVFPASEVVKAKLVFFDAKPTDNVREAGEVKRSELPALKKKWEQKIKPMFMDKTCAPLPSMKCAWCPYRKGNGGPCPY